MPCACARSGTSAATICVACDSSDMKQVVACSCLTTLQTILKHGPDAPGKFTSSMCQVLRSNTLGNEHRHGTIDLSSCRVGSATAHERSYSKLLLSFPETILANIAAGADYRVPASCRVSRLAGSKDAAVSNCAFVRFTLVRDRDSLPMILDDILMYDNKHI